jgi:hypothetical protein
VYFERETDAGGKLRSVFVPRPRVVWQGDWKHGGPDLAILCVDRTLPKVFDWADSFRPGDPVVEAGKNRDREGHFLSAYFAGVLAKTDEDREHLPHSTAFFHSAPANEGDSGGPLLTTSGRLLGVDVGGYGRIGRLIVGGTELAQRPDLDWLLKTLDADAAARL